MKQLAVFSDYACPWCYLARARLKRALAGRDVRVRLLHFPLAPDTPDQGRPLGPYLASKGHDPYAAVGYVTGLLAQERLPYVGDVDRMVAYPTRRAQELAVWAESQGAVDALHDALFHAYQVDNRNLGDVDVLAELAVSVGLDGSAARRAVTSGAWAAEVERHHALAAQFGVRSVPTWLSGERVVVGTQSVEVLASLVA